MYLMHISIEKKNLYFALQNFLCLYSLSRINIIMLAHYAGKKKYSPPENIVSLADFYINLKLSQLLIFREKEKGNENKIATVSLRYTKILIALNNFSFAFRDIQ